MGILFISYGYALPIASPLVLVHSSSYWLRDHRNIIVARERGPWVRSKCFSTRKVQISTPPIILLVLSNSVSLGSLLHLCAMTLRHSKLSLPVPSRATKHGPSKPLMHQVCGRQQLAVPQLITTPDLMRPLCGSTLPQVLESELSDSLSFPHAM